MTCRKITWYSERQTLPAFDHAAGKLQRPATFAIPFVQPAFVGRILIDAEGDTGVLHAKLDDITLLSTSAPTGTGEHYLRGATVERLSIEKLLGRGGSHVYVSLINLSDREQSVGVAIEMGVEARV